jgi:nitrogen regulatory protein PII
MIKPGPHLFHPHDVPKILNAIAKGVRTDDLGDGKITVLLIDNVVFISTRGRSG